MIKIRNMFRTFEYSNFGFSASDFPGNWRHTGFIKRLKDNKLNQYLE
jgi:hypothetical protein